ncbi:hypothetical protein [Rufibacter hautae]|uniref:MerR family transcriptional regulator n=1 Tax=Rufibacter hautae TaxID=2595005 RepID=A0A5B6TC02_9BACT|nr:hypothetical protein [Rufibacter hautae]KAA3437676.1 hypothetical protein FOA19_10240 [Rufibacter hautae]
MEDKSVTIDIPINVETPFDFYMEMVQVLGHKQFSLKDAGITSRVHNNWRSLGIIPDAEEDGKRTYFDFIQYLWIQIVKDLRRFGLPLETIAVVKDYLFDEDYRAGIEWSKEDKAALRKTVEDGAKRSLTEEEFGIIEGSLNSRSTILPYLFYPIVLGHFQHRSNSNIYIFASGKVAVWSEFLLSFDSGEKPDLSTPHINIPLGHYFAQFLSDETKAEFLPKVPILTREEQEVLRAMRNDEVKELIVKFSKTGNKRRADLITKVDKQLSDKQKKEIARILGTRDYSTITMKTQNGTQLSFEEAQRTRL